MNTRAAQKKEAYFRLYWEDIHEWKKAALCHAAKVQDSAGVLTWDELAPWERTNIRAEVVRRVQAREFVEGRAA